MGGGSKGRDRARRPLSAELEGQRLALTTGTRIGPYEIAGLLGKGGMGEVYRARDPRIGRDVAIKILPPTFAVDPERLRRFEQEVRATGLLNHPNIVTIFDTGTIENSGTAVPFIVTELLEGRTLRDALHSGPMSPRQATGYAVQIASGLAAAHAKGLVHRDLKPENLFIDDDGRVKILDFGIAKLTASAAEVETIAGATGTGLGVAVGTIDYMSPEQVRGDAVDHRSDLFSFGLILYEMVVGVRPFARGTMAESISALLRDEPARLPAGPRAELPGLDRVILQCLQKEPAARIQSAQDLKFLLETVGAADKIAAQAPAQRLKRPLLVALGTGVFVVAIALAWMTRAERADSPLQPDASVAARATPFVADEAIESSPAWSPSGNLIAYTSDAAGNADIYVADVSGANPLNLTADHVAVDSHPAWSPSGQRIAFYSERDGGWIFTMNALGRDVRRVVPVSSAVLYTFDLTWSRDDALVYTNFDAAGGKHVYRVASTGGTPECMTCDVAAVTGARAGDISPSGTYLLYKTSEVGARGSVLILNLSTRSVTHLVDQADLPRWSSDGRHVIFVSGRDGTPDLWQVAVVPGTGAAAGSPERITSGLGVASFAASPDGRQILAAVEKRHGNLWSFPADAEAIHDLSFGQRWTTGQFLDHRARWLPDGGVVFESNRRGSLDIWTLAAPNAALARLTTGAGAEHRPRVSPDGGWIAYDAIDDRGEYVHVMRRDGSGVRMPDESWRTRFSMSCCADWSPDGTRLGDARQRLIVRHRPHRSRNRRRTRDERAGLARNCRSVPSMVGGRQVDRLRSDQ